MKKTLTLLLVLFSFSASAQWVNMGNTLQRTSDGYTYRTNLGSPGFAYWYTKAQVDSIVAASTPIFTADIINKTAVAIGSIQPNDTLHSTGKTSQQVTTIIFTQTIHPTYNLPTASISGSPVAGFYERGTTLSITLSSGFTQNQGGVLTGTTYKNGSTIITSPYSISLTANTALTVYKTYATGVCINNNLGVIDCTVGSGTAPNPAPVASGTATSSMVYTIFDKGYAGYDANALVSGIPAQADVLAATLQDNSGGATINTQATAQQGSDKFYFFVTTTIRSHVLVNGTPSDAAFNFNLPITFINARGGTFNGYAHVSKFAGGSTGAVTYVFN